MTSSEERNISRLREFEDWRIAIELYVSIIGFTTLVAIIWLLSWLHGQFYLEVFHKLYFFVLVMFIALIIARAFLKRTGSKWEQHIWILFIISWFLNAAYFVFIGKDLGPNAIQEILIYLAETIPWWLTIVVSCVVGVTWLWMLGLKILFKHGARLMIFEVRSSITNLFHEH